MSKDNSSMAERPTVTKSAQQPAKQQQNGRGNSVPSKSAEDMVRLHIGRALLWPYAVVDQLASEVALPCHDDAPEVGG